MTHKKKKAPASELTPRDKTELKKAVARDQDYSKRIIKSLKKCPSDSVTLIVTHFQDMFHPVRRPQKNGPGVPMTSHLISKQNKVILPNEKSVDDMFQPERGLPLIVKVIVKDQLAMNSKEVANVRSYLKTIPGRIKKVKKQLANSTDRLAKSRINDKLDGLTKLRGAITTMLRAIAAKKKGEILPEYYPIGVAFKPKHDGDRASVAAIKKAASLCKSAKPYLLGEEMYVTFVSSLVTKHLSKYAVMIQRGDASIGVIDPGVPNEF